MSIPDHPSTDIYASACCEALKKAGDPGVGIQHADQNARDSMACDVMEVVRPKVDAWVLEYLTARALRRQDFLELRNGQCRLMSELARELAQTAVIWATSLGPVVESVAQQFYASATTPDQPRRWTQRKPQSGEAPRPLPTPLTEHRRSRARPAGAVFRGLAVSETRSSRVMAVSREHTAQSMTKEEFLRQIVPALRSIPAARIAAVAGLSEKYCAKIRAGRGVPHRSHWGAFARALEPS